MGYTHYWHRPETIPDALWAHIRSDFDKLVLPLSDAGVAGQWIGQGTARNH